MNDNIKKNRGELLEKIVKILKEQLANINPNKDKINGYIDESYNKGYMTSFGQ